MQTLKAFMINKIWTRSWAKTINRKGTFKIIAVQALKLSRTITVWLYKRIWICRSKLTFRLGKRVKLLRNQSSKITQLVITINRLKIQRLHSICRYLNNLKWKMSIQHSLKWGKEKPALTVWDRLFILFKCFHGGF